MFLTLYLQLLGMNDAAASALMALFLGGSAFGGLLGGWLGDKAAQVIVTMHKRACALGRLICANCKYDTDLRPCHCKCASLYVQVGLKSGFSASV